MSDRRDLARTLLTAAATILGLTTAFLSARGSQLDFILTLHLAWWSLGISMAVHAYTLYAFGEGEKIVQWRGSPVTIRAGSAFFFIGVLLLLVFGSANI